MVVSKQCFYPNGDLNSGDELCFPDLDVSPCCGYIADCQANGLCLDHVINSTYRATCTDVSWKSSNCPQYCLKNELNGPGKNFSKRHPRIWQCSDKPFVEGGPMCCDTAEVDKNQQERSCCPKSDGGGINLFSMGSELGSPVTLISPSPLPLSILSSFSLSARSSPTSSLPTVTGSPQNSSGPGGKGSTVGIAVGASLGAAFFLIFIVALYFWLRRQKSKIETAAQETDGHQVGSELATKEKALYQGPQGLQEIPAPEVPASEVSGLPSPAAECPGTQIFEKSSARDSGHLRPGLLD